MPWRGVGFAVAQTSTGRSARRRIGSISAARASYVPIVRLRGPRSELRVNFTFVVLIVLAVCAFNSRSHCCVRSVVSRKCCAYSCSTCSFGRLGMCCVDILVLGCLGVLFCVCVCVVATFVFSGLLRCLLCNLGLMSVFNLS